MGSIVARKVELDGDHLRLRTRFRKFDHSKGDFEEFRVVRIPSLFDEIAIELSGQRTFLVPEGADGFFQLAGLLDLEGVFGPLWYRDAEDGHELRHTLRSANEAN